MQKGLLCLRAPASISFLRRFCRQCNDQAQRPQTATGLQTAPPWLKAIEAPRVAQGGTGAPARGPSTPVAPYPDTYNRSERLLRKARGLRRNLSVQSEGWILGAGVVFTTSRR